MILRKILVYAAIGLILAYYVTAAKYQYEQTAVLSYLLLDKKITQSEYSRLKQQNSLLRVLQQPAVVLGFK